MKSGRGDPGSTRSLSLSQAQAQSLSLSLSLSQPQAQSLSLVFSLSSGGGACSHRSLCHDGGGSCAPTVRAPNLRDGECRLLTGGGSIGRPATRGVRARFAPSVCLTHRR